MDETSVVMRRAVTMGRLRPERELGNIKCHMIDTNSCPTMRWNTTPSAKRPGSEHLTSPAGSDMFDLNKTGQLHEGLRDELDACYHTQGRLDSFPGYMHYRPKANDPALRRLLAHLEAVGCGHGCERVIVTRLNAYLDDASPPSEFRFVYLDCPLDKLKLRPDIATVHKDCLSQEVQTKRRQRESKADPDASAGTSEPCVKGRRRCMTCFLCLVNLGNTLQTNYKSRYVPTWMCDCYRQVGANQFQWRKPRSY
jgi:hypothetical protein